MYLDTKSRAVALFPGLVLLGMTGMLLIGTAFPIDQDSRLAPQCLDVLDNHPHWSIVLRWILRDIRLLAGSTVYGWSRHHQSR